MLCNNLSPHIIAAKNKVPGLYLMKRKTFIIGRSQVSIPMTLKLFVVPVFNRAKLACVLKKGSVAYTPVSYSDIRQSWASLSNAFIRRQRTVSSERVTLPPDISCAAVRERCNPLASQALEEEFESS